MFEPCKILLLFTLVQFTGPDGSPIWIAPDQVIGVTTDRARCFSTLRPYEAHAHIDTQTGGYCVRETVDQVVDKLTREK